MYVSGLFCKREKRIEVVQISAQWRDIALAQFTFVVMTMKVKKTIT
jgi:hypothetical protein